MHSKLKNSYKSAAMAGNLKCKPNLENRILNRQETGLWKITADWWGAHVNSHQSWPNLHWNIHHSDKKRRMMFEALTRSEVFCITSPGPRPESEAGTVMNTAGKAPVPVDLATLYTGQAFSSQHGARSQHHTPLYLPLLHLSLPPPQISDTRGLKVTEEV